MVNKTKSEAGFSLVAVLIIMGVVLFSILLISQAKFRQQGTQKALKVKQSYADVNQALINGIVESFHTKMTANCLTSLSVVNGDLDGRSNYKFVTNVGPAAGTPPTVHQEAAGRCSNAKTPPNGNSTNRFYFCIKLDPDANAPKDSILGAKNAFAEIAVELIDLQTQGAITCNQYYTRKTDLRPDGSARDGSAGMAVTMALYWANQVGADANKFTYSQKALSYIANQN